MVEVKDYPPYLDYPKERKKQTNADRIRAMSDEELAKQLCKGSCPPDKYKFHCTKIFSGGTTECEKCWLDYLTQEVESK